MYVSEECKARGWLGGRVEGRKVMQDEGEGGERRNESDGRGEAQLTCTPFRMVEQSTGLIFHSRSFSRERPTSAGPSMLWTRKVCAWSSLVPCGRRGAHSEQPKSGGRGCALHPSPPPPLLPADRAIRRHREASSRRVTGGWRRSLWRGVWGRDVWRLCWAVPRREARSEGAASCLRRGGGGGVVGVNRYSQRNGRETVRRLRQSLHHS